MTANRPTPHRDKLQALLVNDKLPAVDRPQVTKTLEKYRAWIKEVEEIQEEGDGVVDPLVSSLSRYRKWVDLDLIFDSEEDFLHRQRGQLKLDNSVLEEFLPILVRMRYPEYISSSDLIVGPTNAFSHLSFNSDILNPKPGGGMNIRSKDQDFALALPLYLKASHSQDFSDSKVSRTNLAYLAVEIKTNLDKTMFQEASATAYDLKLALPNSRYFLMCEWLDMTPISTALTAIERVFILRKQKRLPANVRRRFGTYEGRKQNRGVFESHLDDNPFAPDTFRQFLSQVGQLLEDISDNESQVLDRGSF